MGMLDHGFLEVVPRDEVDGFAQDDSQRASQLLLFEAIATGAIGKPHDVDLSCGKETMRLAIEE